MSPFRLEESLAEEKRNRDMIVPLLKSRGCTEISDHRKTTGTATSQTVAARLPDGRMVHMRVKFCWRRPGVSRNEQTYAGVQLLAKVAKGKEESSVRSFALGASKRGADHFLFVQPDGNALVLAGLVPTEVLGDIWASQRKKSQDLLLAGSLGKRRGNNAENGHSPTLWLKDELAPEVASIVWQHEEVLDLLALPSVNTFVGSSDRTGDSFDDIVIFDYDLVGSDEPERIQGLRSEVKRDPRVRKAVLERSGGKCERQTCGAFRAYKGFLDVHHVLGAGTSDRVCNCVALCPNCHREAHISPENAELNLELLAIAEKSAQRSKLKNASLRSR